MKRLSPLHSNAVWPPLYMVVLILVVYGILEAGLWLILRVLPDAAAGISEAPEIRTIRAVILGGAAGLYALHRLWRFHPACNPAYATWLSATPWTAEKPLPLGPLHPVWQDAVIIGALTATAHWQAHIDPALPIAAFGLSYLGGLTLLLAVTRQWRWCYGLGFLWPSLVLLGLQALPAVALVLGIVIFLVRGHRSSLRAFPWKSSTEQDPRPSSIWQKDLRIESWISTPSGRAPSTVGWPFSALSPKIQCRSVSMRASLQFSVLLGWWSFCVIKSSQMEPVPELILVFVFIASAIRLAIYCQGLAPSFNVLGRLATGRILVPGFDQVFVTPVAAVVCAILGGILIRCSGSYYPYAEACVFALCWHVLLSGGPSLRHWVLTGEHRFRIPSGVAANKPLLRPV